MKKNHPFNKLSDRVCATPGCGRKIKQRLVELKDARFCYNCGRAKEAAHGNNISTAREVRTGKRPHRTHVWAGKEVK